MKELLVNVLSPAKAKLFITYAAYVARDLEMTVKYIHVHTPQPYPMGFPGSLTAAASLNHDGTKKETEKARHHFELQISRLNASDPDLPLLEYSVEVGRAPDVIGSYCKDKKVGAVMLSGSKEHSLFSDNARNVDIIRTVKCPVWIVPEGIAYKPFSEILYATDYHKEDIHNMKILSRFASKFPANITAVHISPEADFAERVRGEGFADMIKSETGYEMIEVKVLQEKPGEPLVEELHNFALMMDADLIVLLRENRGFIDRLLHGSRSEKIARETQLPVLIYNEERR